MEVDSINPNTPVESSSNGDGEINNGSGGGPITFDELEEVGASKPVKKAAKKSEKDEEKEEKPEKRLDMTNDADKSGSKKDDSAKKDSKKDESKDSKEGKDSEDGKDPKAEEKPARKTIKAKHEDQELDIDEEAMVPVKINGQETLVPVKELLSNYSGKVAWDKKFTEAGKKEKEIQAKESKLEQSAQKIRQLFEEQDPEIKMYRLAEMAGVDPIEFRKKYLNDNISTLEKYYAMSDDERKNSDLAYEAKVQKHRADTLENSIKDEQSYKELESRVEATRARHQISEDEFATRYEEIAAYQDRMAREHGDKFKREQITPELIAESIVKNRIWDAADKVISTLGWNDQARSQKLMDITENAYKMGLSAEQVTQMVDEVFGSGKIQRTIQKKKEQVDAFKNGKSAAAQPKPDVKEAIFFDDID